MKIAPLRLVVAPMLALLLASCGSGGEAPKEKAEATESDEARGDKSAPADVVTLDRQQIADAGIELVRPTIGGAAGSIDLPATIAADPQGMQVVSASIGGRIVSLTRNLGQPVARGQTLAIIESREAASLRAEVEAARARSALAQSTLQREQRLFAERVSPGQDLIAARTAATEANIALRLARQQLSATGGGGGALNRIAIRSPASGEVVARTAILGQTVAADAELFRVADLARVTVSLSLPPAEAGQVKPGGRVEITAPGRRVEGLISFVSPMLDETTRQVPVIATIDNRAGAWRVGEPVTASILVAATGDRTIAVPTTAVQTVGNRAIVFVRTPAGFKATPVTLGRTQGSQVAILSGLTGNEQVASTNSFTLKAELGKAAAVDED